MAIGKKAKKISIISSSVVAALILVIVTFCAITGFNLKTFIFGTKAQGSVVIDDTSLVSVSKKTPTDGTTPNDYSDLDNFAYFSYKLEHSAFEATTKGAAAAKYNGMNVDQNVYDYRLVYGNYQVSDTRSTSTFVKIYHEQFYEGSKVLYKMGDNKNYSQMKIKARSNAQEFKLYGYGPSYTTGYIVCDETLISSDTIKNDDGTYQTTYILDPQVAPAYYQRKVKTNASIADYPRFDSVALIYTYDSNWNIIEARYKEVYSIYKMKSWILTSNDITEVFTYLSDEDAKEKMDYYYNIYKQSFNLPVEDDIDNDDTYEMTPLDYLGTMASLINSEYIKANASIMIDGVSYNANILVNIINLDVEIEIDGTCFIYSGNKFYIKNGSLSYYDIEKLIPSQNTPNINTYPKLDGLDIDNIISGIMSDINSGSVRKDDDLTYVDITFNFGRYHVPTTFVFMTPDEDTVEFERLDASYNLEGHDIKLSFRLDDSLTFESLEGANELDFAYDVNMTFDLALDNIIYKANAYGYIDILKGYGYITLDIGQLRCEMYYKDDFLYIALDDSMYLKIDVKSFDNVTFDYSYLIDLLSKLKLDGDMGSLVLDINNIPSLPISNLYITFTNSSYKDITVPEYEYIDVYEFRDIYEYALDIALSKSVSINLDNILINTPNGNVSINGSIDVVSNDMTSSFTIEYDKYSFDVEIIYKYDMLYICLLNEVLAIEVSDISNYLENVLLRVNKMLDEEIDLDLYKNIELVRIMRMLDSLVVRSNYMEISLYELIEKALMITVSYEISNGIVLDINTSGIVDLSGIAIIDKSNMAEITSPNKNILYKADVLEILDYAVAGYNLYKNDIYRINLETTIIDGIKEYAISAAIGLDKSNLNSINATADMYILEYSSGKKVGWHQLHLIILGARSANGMIYAQYGNNEEKKENLVKVKSTYSGIEDLILSITSLLKIDVVSKVLSDTKVSVDISSILDSILVGDSLNINLNQSAFDASSNDLISVYISKSADFINLVEINNISIAGIDLSNTAISFDVDDTFDFSIPASADEYYDLSNMHYMFEALYNNANITEYQIEGTIKLTAALIININVPVKIKVKVSEDGIPEGSIELDIPSVNIIFATILKKKKLTIYYKDKYITQNRVDSDGTCYLVRVPYETWLGNALDFIMGEYGMGMPDDIMSSITSADSNGDGFVDAAECVNKVEIGANKFSFDLNMGEIVDNPTLMNLVVTLSSQNVSWTKNGEIHSGMVLRKVDEFKFNMLKILGSPLITLSGSGLNVTNITDQAVSTIDMSAFDSFMSNFELNYEPNVYYKGKGGNYIAQPNV